MGYRFGLPIEDSATVVLESAKTGIKFVVNTGWFSKMIFPDFNFRINLHGTVGYTSTDHFAPRSLYRHAAKEGISNFFRRIVGKKVHYLSYTYYYSSFVKVLNEFFDAIKEDAPIPVSSESQLEVLKIIENVYKQNGGLVSD